MVFYPPSWIPPLPIDPPDSVTIVEFMRNEQYGRQPLNKSRNPFTCGLTGRTYTTAELFQRSEFVARSISKRMGWSPNENTAWDKVIAIFSLNTIDYITAAYGGLLLSGMVTPANAAYSAAELKHQLITSGSKALFTCGPLLQTALQAAEGAGIPKDKVFLLPMPNEARIDGFDTIEDLIKEGSSLPEIEKLRWTKGQGARQPAFLCYSSGTSGLPKAVMISHRNVIANVLQNTTFDVPVRRAKGIETQVVTGVLPMSHIYGLVVGSHTNPFRGDEVIVLPKFDFESFLSSVQKYRINHLVIVPPILIQMLQRKEVCQRYDLSSVRSLISGAAPLGEDTVLDANKLYPSWIIGQAYGMTETCTVVSWTSEHDVLRGSSGSLLPGAKGKLIDAEGKEITEYDKPGELYVQAPSVVIGYLNNEKATDETFVFHEDGRWIRTGDEAIVTKSELGHEHLVIVDRIKELIKVKGHQVAPAELEAHLLTHPAVDDCAVIQVPDTRSGEVPKAFVVRASHVASQSDEELIKIILKHVADHKAPYKHLRGGVQFMDVIPKSPSGKILRRILRDAEREARRKRGGKL